jgi:hypothetical protein
MNANLKRLSGERKSDKNVVQIAAGLTSPILLASPFLLRSAFYLL